MRSSLAMRSRAKAIPRLGSGTQKWRQKAAECAHATKRDTGSTQWTALPYCRRTGPRDLFEDAPGFPLPTPGQRCLCRSSDRRVAPDPSPRRHVDVASQHNQLRLCLVLAGLPMPECNLIIGDDRGPMGRVDLVYVAYKLIIEYEGDQHRTDRNQWNADIDRHEDFARDHWTLIRVTSERTRWPRQLVRAVYNALRANGYDGPPPEFGELWGSLFE